MVWLATTALVVTGGGIGAYEFVGAQQNATPHEVDIAHSKLHTTGIIYDFLADPNTCESHVLIAFQDQHNPGATIQNSGLLDRVCGSQPSHAELAVQADEKLQKIAVAKKELADTEDKASFDVKEKVMAFALGSVGAFVLKLAVDVFIWEDRDYRQSRRWHKKGR
jgi:hypothetical protein